MIAALFIDEKGSYPTLPEVDAWGITRDARLYQGTDRVIAHPPCSVWCQLAYVNQARYGHKVGEDGGCFASALASVRRCGGVLEHPAKSLAWKTFGLRRPLRGSWQPDGDAWVTEVSQGAYGHRARKATWLYVVGPKPEDLDWSCPTPTATVSFMINHGGGNLPRLGKKEAKATPVAFRDLLIRIATG